MSSLSTEAILELLSGEKKKDNRSDLPQGTTSSSLAPHPRCMQVGPLRWAEEVKPCMGGKAGHCASPTLIRVDGVPKCASHALYELNRLAIKSHDGLEYAVNHCECNPGKHSKGNIHAPDCPTYKLLKGDSGE